VIIIQDRFLVFRFPEATINVRDYAIECLLLDDFISAAQLIYRGLRNEEKVCEDGFQAVLP